ncbi:MAG: heme exporter protein CcmB [Candidatus Thorarchaeota archaeon]|nr:heme exporter protein CcmB [Candidatus Thorarchaeota archaeon]MCK5238970.1 heme exporter protein CcmB [Candidatus Thorarchaeota archaeon]
MTSALSAAFAIAKKDIITQIRRPFEVFAMFLFALIAVLAFAFGMGGRVDPEIGGSMLWVIIFLTGMFGFAPVFLSEVETGTLKGISISPIPAWSVYLGKVIYGFVLMGMVEIFLIPITMGLLGFNLNPADPMLYATFILGTLDLAAVGAMASALTMPSESKATIFPLVYFPTATSALILLVELTRILVVGPGLLALGLLLQLLAGHLVVMVTLSAVVFQYALTQ